MGNCHTIPTQVFRLSVLTLIFVMLAPLTLKAQANPPALSGNAAFHQDLRFLSSFSMLPMERTSGGVSTLMLQQSLAMGITDTRGGQTEVQYAIQPSLDYGLRFRMNTWPQGGESPVNGFGMGMHYFIPGKGKNQYALSIDWHQLQSAGKFRHRDIGVIGSFDRRLSAWTFRGYSGISLFNTWVGQSLGFDTRRDTQLHAGIAIERVWGDRFVASLTFPIQRDGFGVSLRLGRRILHTLDSTEQSGD